VPESRADDETAFVNELRTLLTVVTPTFSPIMSRNIAGRLARYELERGRLPEAAAALDTAIEADAIEYDLGVSQWSKLRSTAEGSDLWEVGIEIALRSEPPRSADAFRYAEAGRARVLREQLAQLPLPAPATVPAALVELEHDLLGALRTATIAEERAEASGGGFNATEQAVDIRDRLKEVWTEIARDPGGDRFVALRKADPPDLEQIRRWLSAQPGAPALLMFAIANQRVIAFVVRSDDAQPVAIELELTQAQLSDYAERFVSEVRRYDPEEPYPETWLRLSEPLLGPLLPHLDGIDLLHIVPAGPLHGLPMHALRVSADVTLIERFAVVYAPSVSVALQCGTMRPAGGSDRALVVGDPVGDLPYAADEARGVARMLGARPLIGDDADVNTIRPRLREASHVHLATHASFDPVDPFASQLVLADGGLSARDLLDEQFVTNWLVMSACDSGSQAEAGHEDLFGLARALLYAGVPSLLLSYWAVNDQSTARLMELVYAERFDDRGAPRTSRARALQRASVQMRREFPHTYHWAPFALLGDWS
jgi:CHAT domain-containing protein